MGEEVEELVKRLRNAAESDHAKATILVRFNEPTGKPDWRPMGPSKTLSEELVFAADTIESLRASLTRAEEESFKRAAQIAEAYGDRAMRTGAHESQAAAIGIARELRERLSCVLAKSASQHELPSNKVAQARHELKRTNGTARAIRWRH